ncbi:MAG: putative RNA methyltransferase [Acutalibacter sp.]
MGELLFCCPLCGGALTRQEHRAVCPQGHSFDVARQGYVHLLPVHKMHSKLPGDSREMVEGRRRFLEAGYYAPFRQELCRLAAACASQLGSPAGEGLLLCDAGCGEGYYTAGLHEACPRPVCAGSTSPSWR